MHTLIAAGPAGQRVLKTHGKDLAGIDEVRQRVTAIPHDVRDIRAATVWGLAGITNAKTRVGQVSADAFGDGIPDEVAFDRKESLGSGLIAGAYTSGKLAQRRLCAVARRRGNVIE